MIELMAITQWGELDVLVIDMPPGLGDTALDAVRLLRRAEYLAVTTASRVVIETVRRTLDLLGKLDCPVLGVVENMKRRDSPAVRELAESTGTRLLGSIPFDEGLEAAIGDATRLRDSGVANSLRRIAQLLALG
jgi:ATP-binding protein involved in chromosome partitioning